MGFREQLGKKTVWDIRWQWGLLVIPLILVTYLLFDGDYHGFLYYSYRMLSGALMIIIGGGYKWKPLYFQRFTMFIFCTHWISRTFLFFIPKTEMFSLVRPVFAVVLCTFAGWFLSRFFPKLYSILSGSR